MTIESDFSIDSKIKHQALGFNSSSLSKIVKSLPTSHKSQLSYNNSSKSSTTSSISSPSPTSSISSSSSSTSYSYSLSSGVGSTNTSLKTEQNVLEDSFNTAKSRPTPLSDFILNRDEQLHDLTNSKSVYSSKSSSPSSPSSPSLSIDERQRESTIIDQFPELSIEQQTNLINKWVPFDDIQKKIFVPDAEPKKFIFNYNSSNLSAKKELNYLGIIDVNPDEYTQKYGAELKHSSDLPKYILDIKTPDNLKLAAETEPLVHELEGDVNALKLVDLDREELTIYKQYLQRMGITS